MHKQYEQPIEDWMNQMDYGGMADDLDEMRKRFYYTFGGHYDTYLNQDFSDFIWSIRKFRDYCITQSNLIDKERI